MSLLDDKHLGSLVDELDATEDQSDLNEFLLYEHDARTLISAIPKRVSMYELEFLLSKLYNNDHEYWNLVLYSISKHYKLHYLKMIISNFEVLDNHGKNSKDLVAFLKLNMLQLINNKQITISMSREELEELFMSIRAPTYLLETIKYIDRESYIHFMNTLFKEVEMPYSDL